MPVEEDSASVPIAFHHIYAADDVLARQHGIPTCVTVFPAVTAGGIGALNLAMSSPVVSNVNWPGTGKAAHNDVVETAPHHKQSRPRPVLAQSQTRLHDSHISSAPLCLWKGTMSS